MISAQAAQHGCVNDCIQLPTRQQMTTTGGDNASKGAGCVCAHHATWHKTCLARLAYPQATADMSYLSKLLDRLTASVQGNAGV